jgi:tRNA G18 (ribose-2'-O)-methylase SpoU
MVDKKAVDASKSANPAKGKQAAPKAKSAEGASTNKKTKSLAYGKVQFKAMLYRGKWRFINKAEVDKNKKNKLAKVAKLKAQGIEVKPKVSIDAAPFSIQRLYRASCCDSYTDNCQVLA